MKAIDAEQAQRTGWFEASEAPARVGVYERLVPACQFSCWDGARWRRDAFSAAAAARQPGGSAFQRAPWRGLVEASAAPCATCRGHTVLDRGVHTESGADLIEECPDC